MKIDMDFEKWFVKIVDWIFEADSAQIIIAVAITVSTILFVLVVFRS